MTFFQAGEFRRMNSSILQRIMLSSYPGSKRDAQGSTQTNPKVLFYLRKSPNQFQSIPINSNQFQSIPINPNHINKSQEISS